MDHEYKEEADILTAAGEGRIPEGVKVSCLVTHRTRDGVVWDRQIILFPVDDKGNGYFTRLGVTVSAPLPGEMDCCAYAHGSCFQEPERLAVHGSNCIDVAGLALRVLCRMDKHTDHFWSEVIKEHAMLTGPKLKLVSIKAAAPKGDTDA